MTKHLVKLSNSFLLALFLAIGAAALSLVALGLAVLQGVELLPGAGVSRVDDRRLRAIQVVRCSLLLTTDYWQLTILGSA